MVAGQGRSNDVAGAGAAGAELQHRPADEGPGAAQARLWRANPGDRKVVVVLHVAAVVAASAATGAEGHSSGVEGAWEKELPLELRTTSRLMAEMQSFPDVCTVKLDCLLAFFSIFPARPLLFLP
jgi:hypothetical protein